MARDRSIRLIIRAQVDGAKRALNETADAAKRVGDESERASQRSATAAGRMVQSARDNSGAWTTAGAALAAFGAAGAVAVGGSAKAAIDWQSAFAGVKKTVDDTAQGYAGLSDELRQMARTLPASHSEIASVAEAAGQLGVAREDITSFTRTMIDLGESTNLSAEEAATSIAQMANVMGTSGDDVSRLGSALVELGNNGASTERDIMMMATRLSGAGALIGAAESDVLALANTMSSLGIEAQLGGGVMSRVLQTINSEVISSGDNLAGFAQVAGMSAKDFASAWQADPVAALDAFIQGLAGIQNSGGDTVGVLADLGIEGTENTSVLLRLTGAGDMLTESLEMGAEAWAENSALSEEAGQRYETVASKLQVAKNNIADAGISLGEVFMPAVESASEGLAAVAGAMADLPPALQNVIGWGGAAASAVGLVGGGFLIMTPRVIEGYHAFRDLAGISPRVNDGLRRTAGVVTKGGMLVGGLIALGGALQMIDQASWSAAPGIEEIRGALLDLQTASDPSRLNELIAGMDIDANGLLAGQINTIGDAFDRLTNPTTAQRLEDLDKAFGWRTSADRSAEVIGRLDQALAEMATTADGASAAGQILDTMLQGSKTSVDQAMESMPLYRDALAGLDNEQRLAAESSALLAEGAAALTPEMAEQQAAAEEAAQALAEYLGEISGYDAAFIDFAGALSATQEASRTWAQEQADATETAKDSWEDFYDGHSVNLAGWLEELESQISAQQEWETNMLILSGRVSQGLLDELARLGPEGAPLIAALTTATEEELERAEAAVRQKAPDVTGAYAEALVSDDGRRVMAAAWEELGQEAYTALAAELGAGEVTLQEAIDRYDLDVELGVDDEPAREGFAGFVDRVRKHVTTTMVDAGMDPAQLAMRGWVQEVTGTTATAQMDADPTPAEDERRAWVGGVFGTTATATMDAKDDPAQVTRLDWLNDVIRTRPYATIDAKDKPGRVVLRAFEQAVNLTWGTINVKADTKRASGSMRTFFNAWDNMKLALKLLPGFNFADGGIIQRANGGLDDAGRYVPRRPMMGGPAYGRTNILWGEPETGWEAYISGKPGMRQRNIAVLEEAAHRMGMTVLDTLGPQRFAAGGFSRGTSATYNATLGATSDWGRQIKESLAEFLLGGGMSQGGGGGGRAGSGMSWQSLWALVKARAPEAVLTSAYRPGARTAGYGSVSYHAMGRAIDIVSRNMFATFLKIKPLLPWSELIYTPAGPLQMRNGRNYLETNPRTMRDHIDHIHAAFADGGFVKQIGDLFTAKQPPLLFDKGGMLPPGTHMVHNGLGRPEPLANLDRFAQPDFSALSAAADKILSAAAAIPNRIEVPVQVGAETVFRASRQGEARYGERPRWGSGPQLGRTS